MRSLFNFFTDKSPVVREEKTRAEIELEQTRKELQETNDKLVKTRKMLRKSKRSVRVLQADNRNLRDTIDILTAESNLSAEIDSIKDKALKEQAAEISEQSNVISKLRNEKAELLVAHALTGLECAMLHTMVAALKAVDSVTELTSNRNSA
jgi:uncharacterized protein (DUF3084 family)